MIGGAAGRCVVERWEEYSAKPYACDLGGKVAVGVELQADEEAAAIELVF